MTHGHNICVAGDHLGGIRHALTLGGGRRTGLTETDDAAAQLPHGSLKAQAGAGGRLEEEGCQLLALAGLSVLIGIGDNVAGGVQQLLQLLNGKINNIDQTSHYLAPFTAR